MQQYITWKLVKSCLCVGLALRKPSHQVSVLEEVWNEFHTFSPPSFAQRFLAGLLCSSYVSHHYSANPSMTMFNFLWGIWSAVGKICNPAAHLSSINASAPIFQSLSFVWKEKLVWSEWSYLRVGNVVITIFYYRQFSDMMETRQTIFSQKPLQVRCVDTSQNCNVI